MVGLNQLLVGLLDHQISLSLRCTPLLICYHDFAELLVDLFKTLLASISIVSHVLVVEIKGSEQQAARSGVFLAMARPQPPPKRTTGTGTWSACWPCPACGWSFCQLF